VAKNEPLGSKLAQNGSKLAQNGSIALRGWGSKIS